jgi:hypothetical protein
VENPRLLALHLFFEPSPQPKKKNERKKTMATISTTADTIMPTTSTASVPETATATAANDDDDDDEQEESNEVAAASRIICQQARSLWLSATRPQDLMQVEKLYRQVWEAPQQEDEEEGNGEQQQDSKKRRLRLLNGTTCSSSSSGSATTRTFLSCTTTRQEQQEAGERLALLLLQSGRTQEADDILKRCLPCIKCRLSTQILDYNRTILSFHQHANNNNNDMSSKNITSRGSSRDTTDSIPCRIYDNFLSKRELEFLQNVFADPSSSYWTCHRYAVEPPSPYFSHIIPLAEAERSDTNCPPDTDTITSLEKNFGALGTIIRRIQTILTTTTTTTTTTDNNEGEQQRGDDKTTTNSAHAATRTTTTKPFAPLAQRCTHVEMWAHNRPHVTGHQLHFDSDNEGQGDRIRHPVVSCILYLSESASSAPITTTTTTTTTSATLSSTSSSSSTSTTTSSSFSMSPPSLITNQRRVSHRAADKGWLIVPKLRRLAVFDGRVLHGVLPGQGVLLSSASSASPPRRVTLMLAFWRHIQVRAASPPSQQPPQPSLSSSSVDQAAAVTDTGGTPRRRGGAAQPFPMNQKTDECSKDGDGDSDSSCCWAWHLRQPLPSPTSTSTSSPNDNASQGSKPTLAEPIPLDHVYETLDGRPWTHKLGMPEYNEVFQGF